MCLAATAYALVAGFTTLCRCGYAIAIVAERRNGING
jgi:hypothetical protein